MSDVMKKVVAVLGSIGNVIGKGQSVKMVVGGHEVDATVEDQNRVVALGVDEDVFRVLVSDPPLVREVAVFGENQQGVEVRVQRPVVSVVNDGVGGLHVELGPEAANAPCQVLRDAV